jgi:hypothetical protein
MIRSIIGAVNCSDEGTFTDVNLDRSKNHDKTVAQMSFVSLITLPFGPDKLRISAGHPTKFRKTIYEEYECEQSS